jgi:hypothetical protein
MGKLFGTDGIRGVLVVHRLLSAFEIHSDEEEALASFK